MRQVNFSTPYKLSYYLRHPIEFLSVYIDELKYFVQRGWRGYADRDVWDVYTYHSEIMIGMLTKMRNIAHGYPVQYCPNLDFEADDDPCRCKDNGLEKCGGFEIWKEKLNTMIDGFRAIDEEEEDDFDDGYMERQMARERRFKDGMKLFVDNYQSLWN